MCIRVRARCGCGKHGKNGKYGKTGKRRKGWKGSNSKREKPNDCERTAFLAGDTFVFGRHAVLPDFPNTFFCLSIESLFSIHAGYQELQFWEDAANARQEQ
jgi:hypothetical protein